MQNSILLFVILLIIIIFIIIAFYLGLDKVVKDYIQEKVTIIGE